VSKIKKIYQKSLVNESLFLFIFLYQKLYKYIYIYMHSWIVGDLIAENKQGMEKNLIILSLENRNFFFNFFGKSKIYFFSI